MLIQKQKSSSFNKKIAAKNNLINIARESRKNRMQTLWSIL